MESAFDTGLFSLDEKEVRRLDGVLQTRWGIDLVETGESLESILAAHNDPDVRALASSALKEAQESVRVGGGEDAFYHAMSHSSLIGLATSARRHILLDSAAFLASLIRTRNIQGPILDVGCHAGVVMDILCEVTSNTFHGVDPVEAAIRLAEQKTMDRDHRLSFEVGQLQGTSSQKYELIYCIDSMPAGRMARGHFLKAVREHLAIDGVALIVSQHWVAESPRDIRDQLKNLGFGFLFADVVGGWGGMPNAFEAEGCVVLSRATRESFPIAIRSHVERRWPEFARYANLASTPAREKTQAYFRSSGIPLP